MQDIVAQVSLKICKRCEKELPTSCFSSNAKTKDRLSPLCKPCVCEYSRNHYLANRERRLAQIAEYQKNHPEMKRETRRRRREKFPEKAKEYRDKNRDRIREYERNWVKTNPEKAKEKYRRYDAKHKDKKKAYRQANSKRIVKYKREWREANPEKVKATDAAYRKKRPDIPRESARRRRARILGAPIIEKIDRQAIIERDNATCWLCHKKLKPEQITLDHVIPLSKGGAHAATNLKVACGPCNFKKRDKILTLF